jgi:hypothetical protein
MISFPLSPVCANVSPCVGREGKGEGHHVAAGKNPTLARKMQNMSCKPPDKDVDHYNRGPAPGLQVAKRVRGSRDFQNFDDRGEMLNDMGFRHDFDTWMC